MKDYNKPKRANDSEFNDLLKEYRQLRKQDIRLLQKNNQLSKKNDQMKLNMKVPKLEIRELAARVMELTDMIFKRKSRRKKKKEEEEELEDDNEKDDSPPKKRAKRTHPGKTREIPDRVDIHQDVLLKECPECHGRDLSLCQKYEDHYQEDLVVPPMTEVTRFRHHYYYCRGCQETVHGIGKGEIPGSYIGPNTKSIAALMRYEMHVTYRKVKDFLNTVFKMKVSNGGYVGFDKQIRVRGQPIYERMLKELSDKPWQHVDETGWRDKWLWSYVNEESIVYVIRVGRGQKDLEAVLGTEYSGVLISDMLGAYNKIKCRKQRCLVHLLRLIEKLILYYDYKKSIQKHLEKLKKVVQGIIKLSNKMSECMDADFMIRKADHIGRLRRLLSKEFKSQKVERFRKRILNKIEEFITCLDYAEVCAHNNTAERALRGNVIMRKVTFGNVSEEGERNHEVIMSLKETAKMRNQNIMDYFYGLLTNPSATAEILS